MKKLSILLSVLLILTYLLMPLTAIAGNAEFQDWKTGPVSVDKNKVWTITFSQAIDPLTVNGNVFVRDESGENVNVKLRMKEERALLVQPPEGGYTEGQRYTLYVKDIQTTEGKVLKNNIQMTFFIKGSVEVQDVKIAAEVVKLDPKEVEVSVSQDGQTVSISSQLLEKKQIAEGTLLAVLPNGEDWYGTSGKVLSMSASGNMATLQLEYIPFYEVYEKLQMNGYCDDYQVNPKLNSVPGVTVEHYPTTLEGVQYQHFDFNFEEAPVSIDEQGRISLLSEEGEVLLSSGENPDIKVPIQEGILSGSIGLDMPGVDTDIDFSAIDLVRKGFDGFRRFNLSVNPKLTVDLKVEISGSVQNEKTYEMRTMHLLTAAVPHVPGLRIQVDLRPYVGFSASASGKASLSTYFQTGVRMGIRKQGEGLSPYCENTGQKFFFVPNAAGKVQLGLRAGAHLETGLHFAKKVAEIKLDNHVGIEGNSEATLRLQDRYQVNNRGHREWLNGSYNVKLFYRPSVDARLLKWDKHFSIANVEKEICKGSLEGVDRLIGVSFTKGMYNTKVDAVVQADARYQRLLTSHNTFLGNSGTWERRVGNPFDVRILPFPEGFNTAAAQAVRKLVLNPSNVATVEEKTGIIRRIGNAMGSVAMGIEYFGKSAAATLNVEGNPPNPPGPNPPGPNPPGPNPPGPNPPTPPEETLPPYPEESQWTPGKYFKFDANTGTILGYKDDGPKEVIIPPTIDGMEVRTIEKRAFYDMKLTAAWIPESVTEIREEAFYYNRIQNVWLPSGLQSLGKGAFYNNQLTSVILPALDTIANEAFGNNQLTSVVLPESVDTVGEYAFHNNQLTSVYLSKRLDTIGNNAFSSNKLTSVYLPSGVNRIGERAFQNNELTSLWLPDSVATVGTKAFQNNKLTYLRLSPSMTEIANGCFHNNLLTSVEIPDNVETIHDYAFQENRISAVKWSASLKIVSGFGKNRLTSLELPESVEKVYGFYDNQLTSIRLPNAVRTIGEWAFQNNRLTSVEIPNSVQRIGGYAFRNNRLTQVLLGEGVQSIGAEAFKENRLSAMVFPDSLREIGHSAFVGNRLDAVTFGRGLETIRASAFMENRLKRVILPDSLKEIERNAFQKNQIEELELGQGLREIWSEAFADNKIQRLVLPTSIQTIRSSAFRNNQLSGELILPDGLSTLEGSAFENNKLTSVVIGSGLKEIDYNVFKSNQLTSADIPNNILRIHSGAFRANKLASVEVAPGSEVHAEAFDTTTEVRRRP